MPAEVTNIVITGLGGQGVIKASDILSDAAFRAGFDIKKSEVHGMSQRGGFVMSDVRYGRQVLSPMVPPAEADYVVVMDNTQIEASRPRLRPGGTLISVASLDIEALPSKRTVNVAMLGHLSAFLDIPESVWLAAIKASLPEKLHEMNVQAFRMGREAGERQKAGD